MGRLSSSNGEAQPHADTTAPTRHWAVPVMTAALALLLGLTWVVSDLAVQRESAGIVAAGRSLFSCVGILLLAARSRGSARRSVQALQARPWSLLLSGLLGVAVYAFASLQAIALLGVSIPNLLLTTTPLLSLVVGMLWFRARGNAAAIVGTLIATAGAAAYVVVSFRTADGIPVLGGIAGVALAVVAALSMALYGQHYARLSAGRNPLDLLPGIFGFGTMLLLILLAATGRLADILSVDPVTWLLLAVLGIGIYVPVYVLQHQLIHQRGAVYAATVSLAVPFVVRALEVAAGGAWPSLAEGAAMLVCVVGVGLVLRNPVGVRDARVRPAPTRASQPPRSRL